MPELAIIPAKAPVPSSIIATGAISKTANRIVIGLAKLPMIMRQSDHHKWWAIEGSTLISANGRSASEDEPKAPLGAVKNEGRSVFLRQPLLG